MQYSFCLHGDSPRFDLESLLDLIGFHIWRSTTGVREDGQLLTTAPIPSRGGIATEATYAYRDFAERGEHFRELVKDIKNQRRQF